MHQNEKCAVDFVKPSIMWISLCPFQNSCRLMRSATPCCVSSLMWLPFVEERQKTKANHLDQFPVEYNGKFLPFSTLTCSIPIFTAVTGVHFTVFYENLIIYVWPCNSFPIEKPETSLLSLLLKSSLVEFSYELLISFEHQQPAVSDLLWPFLGIPFFLRWLTAQIWDFLVCFQ